MNEKPEGIGEDAFKTNSQALMESCGLLRNIFDSSLKITKLNNPTWIENEDARLTVFNKFIILANNNYLAHTIINDDLTKEEWWRTHIKQTTDAPIPIEYLIYRFGSFIKVGFATEIFNALESSFRVFVKSIDSSACNNGTGAFTNIYNWLLKKLDLQEYCTLLELMTCIRNTIHNFGVYYHRSQSDRVISFDGEDYEFKIGEVSPYSSWEEIFKRLLKINEMLLLIVESPIIKNQAMIDEPLKGR